MSDQIQEPVTINAEPSDQKERLAALNPLRSLCVTAPAGSGKTELLTQRVLMLLARVNQPEEILAITFTRKAAAEMHHRISEALRFAKDHPRPKQPHKQLTWELARNALLKNEAQGWQLLSNPGRLKIQTIDSFSNSLTRQMPVLSNFGAQPRVLDKAEHCYIQAVHDLINQLETHSQTSADLKILLSHLDNDLSRAESLLVELLQKRDQWLTHISSAIDSNERRENAENILKDIIHHNISAAKQLLSTYAAELLPLWDYAGANLVEQHSDSNITQLKGICALPDSTPASIPQWEAIVDLLLTEKDTWRKTININMGFPPVTLDGDKKRAKQLKETYLAIISELSNVEGLTDSLIEIRKLPSAFYTDYQWDIYDALNRLLPELAARLRLVFQQQGEVDYTEIAMSATRALGDGLAPSELALKLDYQLKHILIDEFQDTSITQFRLVERLIEGWSEYNEQHSASPNTLFIVGDGMQSIYGFRGANVGLFLDAKKNGISGLFLDDLHLTVNFRSDPAVVAWGNETYSKAFPRIANISRGAVPFEAATAFNQPSANSEIGIFGFTGDNKQIREAQKAIELIIDAQKNNPDSSVALLVRSRNHLLNVVTQLSKTNLAWQATDIDPLESYRVVANILSMTRAFLNLADDVSWLAFLRSPLIGLDNSELFHLFSDRKNETVLDLLLSRKDLAHICTSTQKRLAYITSIIEATLYNRQRLNCRDWLEGAWLQMGGASLCKNDLEQKFANDYFDLIEKFQQQGVLLQKEFEVAVEKLYARPVNDNAPIKLMTIHKAKGLEFDTVIILGMVKQSRSDTKSLLMWREYIHPTDDAADSKGLIVSTIPAKDEEKTAISNHLSYEQSQSTQLENTRLLYVATTRAINKLYLLFTTDIADASAEPKAPASNSLLARIWPTVKESVQWQHQDKKHHEQLSIDYNDDENSQLVRIKPDWVIPKMNVVNPLNEFYLPLEYGTTNNIPDVSFDPLARCVGDVVHWLLEDIGIHGSTAWESKSSIAQREWLEALLQYQQLPQPLWSQAIIDITQAINNTLQDEAGQWILKGHHQLSQSEYELLTATKNGIKKRIIDRYFIDSEGGHWIIDYKTGRAKTGESQQNFITREKESYKAQLSNYKEIITTLKNIDTSTTTIRTAVYFTAYPILVEIE